MTWLRLWASRSPRTNRYDTCTLAKIKPQGCAFGPWFCRISGRCINYYCSSATEYNCSNISLAFSYALLDPSSVSRLSLWRFAVTSPALHQWILSLPLAEGFPVCTSSYHWITLIGYRAPAGAAHRGAESADRAAAAAAVPRSPGARGGTAASSGSGGGPTGGCTGGAPHTDHGTGKHGLHTMRSLVCFATWCGAGVQLCRHVCRWGAPRACTAEDPPKGRKTSATGQFRGLTACRSITVL